MTKREKVKDDFKVRSLERIGTLDADRDVGVVRVSGAFLRRHARRNALLRISMVDAEGGGRRSIVRIVRAATTGNGPLHLKEIALQYDDRLELGIKKADTMHRLEIEPVNDWLGLPRFLLGHPSPLVRREAVFAIALMIVGATIGAVIGFLAGIMI